eukprot:645138-Prymnesium_polylepis.1
MSTLVGGRFLPSFATPAPAMSTSTVSHTRVTSACVHFAPSLSPSTRLPTATAESAASGATSAATALARSGPRAASTTIGSHAAGSFFATSAAATLTRHASSFGTAGSPSRTSVAATRSRHASSSGTPCSAGDASSPAASTNASPNSVPTCTPMSMALLHHAPHAKRGRCTPPFMISRIA